MARAARPLAPLQRMVLQLGLFVTLLCGGIVRAEPDERAADKIFSSVMSPFCPGRLLRDCPSSQATALKDKIRANLSSGMNEEQVVASLVAVYGREIQAAPAFHGISDFESLAWLAPALFAGCGLIFLGVWLAARTGSEEAMPQETRPQDEA